MSYPQLKITVSNGSTDANFSFNKPADVPVEQDIQTLGDNLAMLKGSDYGFVTASYIYDSIVAEAD